MKEAINNTTIENHEMKEILQKLEDYISRGYYLHGSKKEIEILEPRQAQNDEPFEATNQKAVYATDDVRIAIVKALFDRKDESKKDWESFYHTSDKEEISVGGENVTFTSGFIHVLPKEKFQEIEDEVAREIVSYNPVTPVEIIHITPEILELIPGITYDLK